MIVSALLLPNIFFPPSWRLRLRINALLVLVALYLSIVLNQTFWARVTQAAASSDGVPAYRLFICLFVALNVLLLLAMAPLSARITVKPILMLMLLVASACSYFMGAFGIVLDQSMIANALQTDTREASELINLPMALHILLFGVAPAVLVSRVDLICGSPLREFGSRVLLIVLAVAALLACVLSSYKDVSLWGRENRQVRLYVNPTYPLYAVGSYVASIFETSEQSLTPIAMDAARVAARPDKPRVVVMVVGETARAANFQLSGYARATTPQLAAIKDVVNFKDFWSCGTSTAESVPCMFSRLGHDAFSRSKARREENLLDVLQRVGVDVLWRDNNSDSKGVAVRVPFEDFRHRAVEGLCNADGCYDEVLLDGLGDLLVHGDRDRFIVLHLLGSHGPSYYKRYPPAFRRFTPDCAQDDVQNCSRQAIVNAYDNTILYTDHVLARIVDLLKQNRNTIQPTLLYMSDHGESLGESGIYLHAMPYALAPDEQKHVPFVLWSPAHDADCLRSEAGQRYSHDNLFSTVLGLFGVSTEAYHAQADLMSRCPT